VYTVRAEVTLKDGAIYNKTTLKGEGFKKDGFVLGQELKDHLPIVSMVIPNGEGIKIVDQRVTFAFIVIRIATTQKIIPVKILLTLYKDILNRNYRYSYVGMKLVYLFVLRF